MVKTIGIFPASGSPGTSTYTHLLQRVPGGRAVLVNRFPEKVPPRYAEGGVDVRQASFESAPEELRAAFSGVEVLFLIAAPSYNHAYRVKVQLPAIDAARAAGVKHVFYSSLAYASDPSAPGGIESTSRAAVMQAHLESEACLAKLASEHPDFTYTSVREGLYSESLPVYTGHGLFDPEASLADGALRIPHDETGPGVAWADREERGEATAALLARYAGAEGQPPFPARYVNGTALLTGPRAWTVAESVEVLARAKGTPLRVQQVPVEEYAAVPYALGRWRRIAEREAAHSSQVLSGQGGLDAAAKRWAREWATVWDAIREGEASVVTTELEELLGRKPEDYEVTIRKLYS